MDKEQRLAERAQELREQEAIAETASKLADRDPGKLNTKEEDLDGRDEALKPLRVLRIVERKCKKPVKRLRSSEKRRAEASDNRTS